MSDSFKTELAGIPWQWDLTAGKLSTAGRPAIVLWLDPSLHQLLAPLVDEIGAPLAALLIAHEASQGAEIDYQAMVTKPGSTFREGFLAWGQAVGGSGWGRFELRELDLATHRAVIRVKDAWELRLPDTDDVVGAFGICTDVTLLAETEAQLRQIQRQLEAELQEKKQTIRALSTPGIRLSDGILLMPLVGAKEVAGYLVKTMQAARLLGSHCLLVGISAEVAQSMVRLGVDLSQVSTHANLESGLKVALASRQRSFR